MEDEVVIIQACRTAVGSFNGVTSNLPATHMGAAVIKEVINRSKIDPKLVDEVVMGHVLTADTGQNPARQATILAGISENVPSFVVNKVCGSGLKAVALAAQAIRCRDCEVVIAGGQENMSLAPHVLPHSRIGQRMDGWEMEDSMIKDGLEDVFNHYHMGITAENVAEKYKITREEQDEFAYLSQMKIKKAVEEGRFKDEIVPIEISQKRGEPIIFERDEHPRGDTTKEGLMKLRPAFKKDGTVTAGNSAGLNNGAAALLLTTGKKAKELNISPIARVVAFQAAGVDPKIMGTGPILASRKCLEKAGWSVKDLDLIEANEAFAAPSIAVNREMNWDVDKVNVNGGSIGIGHPIGASGARILVTLLHAMVDRKKRRGLATLCIGGGMGFAMAVERFL